MSVCVEITIQATPYNNKNPRIKVRNNQILLGEVECVDNIIVLTYHVVPSENNVLSIEFYNKSFGDNRQWDCGADGELKVKVLDIKFDDVSVDYLLTSSYFSTTWSPRQLEVEPADFIDKYNKFKSNGDMVFNGFLEFEWNMPVYDFLIERKFKESYDSSLAYHSNKTELFHYEQGQNFLNEIKLLIKQNES